MTNKNGFTLAEAKKLPSPQGKVAEQCSAGKGDLPSPSFGHLSERKCAFTLAEVLITLGVIGVVAAMTISVLTKNYQKQVFYTQFRKAATTVENALKLYAVDNGCEGEINNCFGIDRGDRFALSEENFVDNFSKYFKISKLINEDNYEDICKNYAIKLGFNRDDISYENGCVNELGIPSTNHAFITTDGMLFNFSTDLGGGISSFVDVNGLKGPHAIGRDVFVFYLLNDGKSGIIWGGNESQNEDWGDDMECTASDGSGCAGKLLKDGKMDY